MSWSRCCRLMEYIIYESCLNTNRFFFLILFPFGWREGGVGVLRGSAGSSDCLVTMTPVSLCFGCRCSPLSGRHLGSWPDLVRLSPCWARRRPAGRTWRACIESTSGPPTLLNIFLRLSTHQPHLDSGFKLQFRSSKNAQRNKATSCYLKLYAVQGKQTEQCFSNRSVETQDRVSYLRLLSCVLKMFSFGG